MKFFLLFASYFVFSQQNIDLKEIDSLYREDQFYITLGYNLNQNKPTDYIQNGYSAAASIGILRDIPINKTRTWALALGVGYNYNTIRNNLRISELTPTTFSIESDYNKNNLYFHTVEFPFEIRWRNSTPNSHKFWRIYPGFKAQYLFSSNYKFEGNGVAYQYKNLSNLNKWQYGPYIAIGYNTVNIYTYYSLSPLFKNSNLNNTPIKINTFAVGLQFYIL